MYRNSDSRVRTNGWQQTTAMDCCRNAIAYCNDTLTAKTFFSSGKLLNVHFSFLFVVYSHSHVTSIQLEAIKTPYNAFYWCIFLFFLASLFKMYLVSLIVALWKANSLFQFERRKGGGGGGEDGERGH